MDRDSPPEAWLDDLLRSRDLTAANQLFSDWVHGKLAHHRQARIDAAEFDRRVGRVFVALDKTLEEDERDWVSDIQPFHLRRWCWAEQWIVWAEDEDLAFFDCSRDDVAVIMEEVARGCPKSETVLHYLAHALRDKLNWAMFPNPDEGVRDAAGIASAMKTIIDRTRWQIDAFVAAHEQLGRELDASVQWFAEYCGRLATYDVEGPVDEPAAEQRVRDTWRCAPPAVVSLARAGDWWVADPFPRKLAPGRLFINANDGRMAAVTGKDNEPPGLMT